MPTLDGRARMQSAQSRRLLPRTLLCDTSVATGAESLRKVKKLAERTGREMRFVAARGKGSHGRLYLGSAFTIVKDPKKEIGSGLLLRMCKDLGINARDL